MPGAASAGALVRAVAAGGPSNSGWRMVWTRLETRRVELVCCSQESFAFDGESPVRGLHAQRPGGTDRPLALIIEALGSFHGEFALAGRAQCALFGFGDQDTPVWLALGAGAFQH